MDSVQKYISVVQDSIDWMKHDIQKHGGHFDPKTMTCKLREENGLPDAKNHATEEKKEQPQQSEIKTEEELKKGDEADAAISISGIDPVDDTKKDGNSDYGNRDIDLGMTDEEFNKLIAEASTPLPEIEITLPKRWTQGPLKILGEKIKSLLSGLDLQGSHRRKLNEWMSEYDASTDNDRFKQNNPCMLLNYIVNKMIARGKYLYGDDDYTECGHSLKDTAHVVLEGFLDGEDEQRKKYLSMLIPKQYDKRIIGCISKLQNGVVQKIYQSVSEFSLSLESDSCSAYCIENNDDKCSSRGVVFLSPEYSGNGDCPQIFFHEVGHAIFNSCMIKNSDGNYSFSDDLLTDIYNAAQEDCQVALQGETPFGSVVKDVDDGKQLRSILEGALISDQNTSADIDAGQISDIFQAAGYTKFWGHSAGYYGDPPPKNYCEKRRRCHEMVANIVSAIMMNGPNTDWYYTKFPRLAKVVTEKVLKMPFTWEPKETEVL